MQIFRSEGSVPGPPPPPRRAPSPAGLRRRPRHLIPLLAPGPPGKHRERGGDPGSSGLAEGAGGGPFYLPFPSALPCRSPPSRPSPRPARLLAAEPPAPPRPGRGEKKGGKGRRLGGAGGWEGKGVCGGGKVAPQSLRVAVGRERGGEPGTHGAAGGGRCAELEAGAERGGPGRAGPAAPRGSHVAGREAPGVRGKERCCLSVPALISE